MLRSLKFREKLVFLVPGDDPRQIQGSPHLDRLKPHGQVIVHTDKPATVEEQLDRARDAHIILNSRSAVRWHRDELRGAPNLRMIALFGVGTDIIDLVTAKEMGVVVSNQPGRTAPIVAEHIIGLMLAAAKRSAFQTAEIKAGRWERRQGVFLRGKTLGLIGTGNVGREVAAMAAALGMKVIAWTFNPSPQRAEALGVTFVELDELLRRSDVVSIQVRLSDDSREMLGNREFDLMKPGALFVNGGRGELVETAALVDALNSGHLAGAGLDVFDAEPLPPDHPILSCEQVVLTPHTADLTPEIVELLNEGAVDNVLAFLQGRSQNVVT